MPRHHFILLLLILSLNPYWLLSQTKSSVILKENIIFHHFTTEQGLPHDAINCILQDKKGFLWIGTTNGLCRYDGSRFLIYKNDPADSFSISNDVIISLSLDGQDRVWIGTWRGGLNMLNQSTHGFIYFKNSQKAKPLLSNNFIPSVQHLDNTHIAIAQGDLLILDTKNKTSEFIRLPKNTWSEKFKSMVADTFSTYGLFIDHEKKWWLTGESGLVQYDPDLKKMNLFSLRKDVTETFKNYSTLNCKEDDKENIWIASSAGLFEYERASDKFIQHYPAKFLSADSKTPSVKAILCNEDGTIWFGTDNGLFHYLPASGNYYVYRSNPKQSLSISDNNINCLYEDKQHILWIGTQNGLNAIYPDASAFNVYQNIPGDEHSLQSNITDGSFKDDKGNIWVGTGKALECIDAITHKVSQYLFFDPRLKEPIAYNVMAVFLHNTNSCWVGTWGAGMQLFDIKKRKFIASYAHFANSSLSISSNFIKSFCKDAAGNLWIATWNGGIEKFDCKKKIFEHFNTSDGSGVTTNFVNKVYFDNHTVWATVISGLLKYDSARNKFEQHRITDDTTNVMAAGAGAIVADGKGNLWVGSGKGLTKFTVKDNHFEKMNLAGEDGVGGICISNDKSLWLATQNGLKKYDPNTGIVETYNLKDGLPMSYFPGDCYIHQSAGGEILVNSDNGLIHFYPEKITPHDEKPVIHITSVKIKNKELEGLGDVNQLHHLNLKYYQDYLTIGFAAINFINPSQNKYAYKLEGIDNDWVYSGNRNEAIYTNLSSGNYVFRIKASNDAGIWNEEGITLNIHISTPWWRTWWFYGLCFITIMGIVYALYRIRISRILGEQKLRNKIARDLHDDIGSTLSGIKLFSNMAQTKLVQEKSGALDIVERIGERSEKMIEAMSDIVWSINPVNDSMENMLVRMKQYAAEMMEPKNIAYKFLSDEKIARAKMNLETRKDIYLIFKESINNAVKHSNCRNVLIELKSHKNNLEMIIGDDGIGFNETDLNNNGNGIGNLKQRAKSINGKITISTKPENGTIVTLILPVT